MPSWDGAMDNVKEGIRAKQRLRDRQLSMSGAPDFESMPYEDQAPRGTTPMSSAAPMTRTISQIPQGETEQSVRDAIKSKMRSRSQIIQRALTTQDPNERAALIQARYGLEDELKPLGATLPKTFVTPEGAQASRDSLRQKLAVDLAKQRAAESAPQPQVDPALAAGTAMAPYSMRVPSKDPQNEIMRQQMLRIKAGEPMLTGTGSDMEVTTPDIMEMRRRRAVQDRLAEAQRGSPTEIADKAFPAGPVDAGAINRRFAEQADMQGNAAPEATRIMQADKVRRAFERNVKTNQMDLVQANQQADINQAKLRATGQDTESLVAKQKALQAQALLDATRRQIQSGTPIVQGPQDAHRAIDALEKVGPHVNDLRLGPFAEFNKKIASDIDAAVSDVEGTTKNLGPEDRSQIIDRLRKLRQSINDGRSNLGLSYDFQAKQLVERIDRIVAQLTGGSQQ